MKRDLNLANLPNIQNVQNLANLTNEPLESLLLRLPKDIGRSILYQISFADARNVLFSNRYLLNMYIDYLQEGTEIINRLKNTYFIPENTKMDYEMFHALFQEDILKKYLARKISTMKKEEIVNFISTMYLDHTNILQTQFHKDFEIFLKQRYYENFDLIKLREYNSLLPSQNEIIFDPLNVPSYGSNFNPFNILSIDFD